MKQIEAFLDRIITGDCVEVMRELPDGAVDLVLTDPPYLSNFRDRTGRSFQNDNPADTSWLVPSYREMYRVLKRDSYCVSFYGFARADLFLNAWREAGFDPVEHMVFVKGYASSEKFIRRYHENAYLLAKGRPRKPGLWLPSVLEWRYTGNELHPSQKPVMAIVPLVLAFSERRDIVFDPFAGSGTTCVAAAQMGRRYIGIEIDPTYVALAQERLQKMSAW